MTEGEDKIKDLFSDRLKGFQPEVPASIWEGIESSLSQTEVIAPPRKRFFLKTAVTVASVAAALLAIFFMIDTLLEKPDKIITDTEIAKVLDTPKEELSIQNTLEEQKQIASVSTSGLNTQQTKVYSPVSDILEVNEKPIVDQYIEKEVQPEDKNIAENTAQDPVVKKEEANPRSITSDEAVAILKSKNEEIALSKSISNKKKVENFSLGVFSNSNISGSTKKQMGGSMPVLKTQSPEIQSLSLYSGNNDYEMKHDQPVSVSLTVSKGIAPNLSIETGIVYTYLSSTLKSSGAYEMREKQKFHYLGVPLNLNYTFFRHRRFNTYLTVGGMIEKDVKGTYKGGVQNDMEKTAFRSLKYEAVDLSKSIKQDNPQLSVHSSLGVSYRLYNRLSIHGNVGCVYYFDASNEYRTIYSDRDFQLDLNLGLRWEF